MALLGLTEMLLVLGSSICDELKGKIKDIMVVVQ